MAQELSDHDVARIVSGVADALQNGGGRRDFYIEPEAHFMDHIKGRQLAEVFDAETCGALKEMAQAFQAGRKRYFKVFLFLVAIVIGSLLLAWYALFHSPVDAIKQVLR